MSVSTAISLLALLVLIAGCDPSSPVGRDLTGEVGTSTPAMPTSTDWVASADGELSFRIVAAKSVGQSIEVDVELRNNGKGDLTVIRPFADRYAASSSGLELHGSMGELQYAGPVPSYSLGMGAFLVVPAGNTLTGKAAFRIENYPPAEMSDKLWLYFTYEANKWHRDILASFRDARKERPKPSIDGLGRADPYAPLLTSGALWVGQIRAGPVVVQK